MQYVSGAYFCIHVQLRILFLRRYLKSLYESVPAIDLEDVWYLIIK